jgi:hypothetical protein
MFSLPSLYSCKTENGIEFFIRIPTPLLLIFEFAIKRYAQYGLHLKELFTRLRLDVPAVLHSLISDRKIISLLRLTIPCIFSKWLSIPRLDMLRELQLIDDIDTSGTGGYIVE